MTSLLQTRKDNTITIILKIATQWFKMISPEKVLKDEIIYYLNCSNPKYQSSNSNDVILMHIHYDRNVLKKLQYFFCLKKQL